MMITPLLHGFACLPTRVAFLCLAGLLPCATFAADTPAKVLERLVTPDRTTIEWAATHAVSNGYAVAIATLQSMESIDSVISFYQQHWTQDKNDGPPGFVESVLPGWRMISRLHDGYNIVVQLNTSKQIGTSGLISVMAVGKPAIKEHHGEFSNLALLSSNRSVDGVDTSWMRVYASSVSVSQTHHIYRQRLTGKGWQLLSESDTDDGVVIILARGPERLEVSILRSRDFGSVVVAHQVTSK